MFPIDCFPQENAGSAQNNSMGGKHRELDKKVSKLRKMVQVFIIIIIIIIIAIIIIITIITIVVVVFITGFV